MQVLHICYLCCLYGNPLLVEIGLIEFLNSIVLNILHTFKSNQNNTVFVNVSVLLLFDVFGELYSVVLCFF